MVSQASNDLFEDEGKSTRLLALVMGELLGIYKVWGFVMHIIANDIVLEI